MLTDETRELFKRAIEDRQSIGWRIRSEERLKERRFFKTNGGPTQKNRIERCKLDNKAKLYAPITDHQEENRGCIIKCFNWRDHELKTTDHLKRLLFFFLKVVIVAVGFAFIIYFYFFVKKLFA